MASLLNNAVPSDSEPEIHSWQIGQLLSHHSTIQTESQYKYYYAPVGGPTRGDTFSRSAQPRLELAGSKRTHNESQQTSVPMPADHRPGLLPVMFIPVQARQSQVNPNSSLLPAPTNNVPPPLNSIPLRTTISTHVARTCKRCHQSDCPGVWHSCPCK